MLGTPTVFVVDDELGMRHSLQFLLSTAGYQTELYASAEEFLERGNTGRQGCLLVDVRMTGMTGLELQERLQEQHAHLPVVVMSGYADTPSVVRAIHNGAIDFLEKPLNDQKLLDRIAEAIQRSQAWQEAEKEKKEIVERMRWLSPREREVMDLLVVGKSTKEIATQLAISTKTVDVHRARVLEKMQAENVVELVVLLSEIK